MTTAQVTVSDIGGGFDYPLMATPEAIELLRIESAKHPASWYAVTYTDCPKCSGEGWSENGHCFDCDERTELLVAAA